MELIKFSQNACRPCGELDQFLEHGLGVEPDKVYILDGGDDSHLEEAGKYGIMNTPVLILLDDNNKEIDRVIGTDREEVTAIVEKRGLI
ncbi:thioredoxin family protein [Peribacillus asahii]|uniref:thioredoxin family protein n=1 Tax=Peribacillus asahii TaxID=228899 RepID=UPI003811C2AA